MATAAVDTLPRTFNLSYSPKVDRHPLHEAVIKSQAERISKLLMENGLDVNTRDERGRTPLHRAVKRDAPALVRLLLSNPKVDVNALDDDGKTPLSMAITSDKVEVVAELVMRGDIEVSIDDLEDARTLVESEDSFHSGLRIEQLLHRTVPKLENPHLTTQAVRALA